MKEEMPPTLKPAPVDPEPLPEGTLSAEKVEGVEGMETDPLPNKRSMKA
jgi:hypothetical protein